MRKRLAGAAAVAATVLLAACTTPPPAARTVSFFAMLDGLDEVPPKSTWGLGSATVTLGLYEHVVQWNVAYNGLSGPVTAAHIHCGANPGANAPVSVPFHGSLASPITGIASVSPEQRQDLLANRCYVNLHTQQNPGGEIRGQLVRMN
jgi:hypothetical protein